VRHVGGYLIKHQQSDIVHLLKLFDNPVLVHRTIVAVIVNLLYTEIKALSLARKSHVTIFGQ